MGKAIIMGKPGMQSVRNSSQLLKRLYFVERSMACTLGGYLVSVSHWGLKKKLPQHIWEDTVRADSLRTRVLEMRYPKRDVDTDHDRTFTEFLSGLIRCRNDAELVAGVYFVIKQKLSAAYRHYMQAADPLDDAPTIYFLKYFAPQIEEQVRDMRKMYEGLQNKEEGESWKAVVEQGLQAVGGLFGGIEPRNVQETGLPAGLGREPYVPPVTPARDSAFEQVPYHLPPWIHVSADRVSDGAQHAEKFMEKQVRMGINHVNEIWASEITGLVMWRWDDMPWPFYVDMSRWCYDESRHCMMGEERLQAWGFEVGVDYPVSYDTYVANSHLGELEVMAALHRFERFGPEWKRGLKDEFECEGDTSSSQDFDYDWADESIHLMYGHKWLLHRLKGDADQLDVLSEICRNRWVAYMEEQRKVYDYEPYLSRIKQKIARLEQYHARELFQERDGMQ